MHDFLAQVVGLLQPNLSSSKLVEGSGAWRVRRAEQGKTFCCAILEGAVKLEVGDSVPLLLSTNDFVLIPAAYDFALASAAPAAPRGLNSLPAELRPNVFGLGDLAAKPNVRMLIGYCTFGSSDAALLVSLLPSLIYARGEARLATLIQMAAAESRDDRAARDIVPARLMEILFIEALRASPADYPRGILRGLGDERVASAIRIIHEQPTARWTVATLARAAAMSRSAFFDRFRHMVGMAPMEYLLHWRMVLAKQLLEQEDLSVADIARRVGYGSASTFSVAFARHVGTPPSRYARRQAA